MTTSTGGQQELRVAMVGHGFMGAAHSQAWRVAPHFFDLPLEVRRSVVVGRDAGRAAAAAAKFGWESSATDWREVIARDDVDLVDVVAPGDAHAEVAIAALEAGKHVLCEKPLGNTLAEAEAMNAAAEKAAASGAKAMVGFSYRRVPAVAFAKQLVAEGAVGQVRQVRASYLQDWLSDASAPMTWRLDKQLAGSGALGDIGAHAIDLVQHVLGTQIAQVSGLMHTFVTERPLSGGRGLSASSSGGAGDEVGKVTVDDAAMAMARTTEGALVSLEASRFATGRKNGLHLEVYGSDGAIVFDLEDMNVLDVYDAREGADRQGFKRILVTEPEHPWMAGWWPAGHIIGYEHTFTHQVVDLVGDIAAGRQPTPSFAEGLQVQRVLDALERSSGEGSAWTPTSA
jgi:predicted dehydrogenase